LIKKSIDNLMTNEEKDNNKQEEENQQYIRRLLDSEAETRAEPAIEPKPEEPASQDGTTRASPPRRTPESDRQPPSITLDKDNMPLPRRVDEVDMDWHARYDQLHTGAPSRPRSNTQTRSTVPAQSSHHRNHINRLEDYGGCLVRILILALFGVVILTIIGGSALLFSIIRSRAPCPALKICKRAPLNLRPRASWIGMEICFTRSLTPTLGVRTYVPLDQISPALVAATIATEDKDFYNHPGL
jgi:hypothetical protein